MQEMSSVSVVVVVVVMGGGAAGTGVGTGCPGDGCEDSFLLSGMV